LKSSAPSQVAVVEKIENLLESLNLQYFSPRQTGVTLSNLSPEERKNHAHWVFEKNVEWLEQSDVMVAVIDDRDPGVMWEIGFFYAGASGQIITYTESDYGLNVMIQECVDAHCKGIDRLRDCLKGDRELYEFRDFQPGSVT